MKTTAFIFLFRKSLRGSLSGKLWKWLLSGLGSLCALLLLGKNFLGTTVEKSVITGLQLLIGVFLIRLLLFYFSNLIVLVHYRFKESLYGDAIILLKDAFARVHNLRYREKMDDGAFLEAMTSVCNNLKAIFDRKTKASCSVSIKVPIEGQGPVSADTIMKNLCRDSAHYSRDNEQYKRTRHTIIGNTAYSVVLSRVSTSTGKKLYYLNNKVSDTPDYLSSSPCPEGRLYYDSELVYPIIPALPARRPYDSHTSHVWGFLCIVCTKPGKLDEKYDVAIAEGVCDGIFEVILKQNKNTNAKY